MKIAVIGTGYVGLVTATCLADSGNEVIGVDIDPQKIATLERGALPIYEPGLLELVQRSIRHGRLRFTTSYADSIPPARLIFIAVGTPEVKPHEATPEFPAGSASLKFVDAATDQIAATLKGQTIPPFSKIVVTKSTVPVGTNKRVASRFAAAGFPMIDVASNPEFLKEGAAVDDFMTPDRVVVGVRHPEVAEALRELYSPFLRTDRPFLVMSPESAEMTKYAANAMLATKISFINEMANLCDEIGADINDVRRGIGHDQRIGFQFLHPGPGYGGSCFPKDVRSLINIGERHGIDLRLARSVDAVNEIQKQVLPNKIKAYFGPDLPSKTLAIWGLAFKPRTDDIREAPALVLIDSMIEAGVALRVHDPEAIPHVRARYGDRLVYCDRPYGALEGADALALVTEWPDFRTPDFTLMRGLMKSPVVFDGRNVYDPRQMASLEFEYFGIGRGAPQNRQEPPIQKN